MSFLNLVEQHDAIGLAAHFFGELSALLVTHVARRGTYKPRDIETLSKFAHVDADERIFAAKHVLGEFLGEPGFTYTRRPKEHKHTNRVVGVFQTHAVALDRLNHLVDGFVLANNSRFELGGHVAEPDALGLGHALHRHSGHHRHHFGHFGLGDGFAMFRIALFPFTLQLT